MARSRKAPAILVVDDDPECREFVCHAAGDDYAVLQAATGEEALRVAGKSRPGLIILDVMMPGGQDGFTTFRKLRENPKTKNIPILMLSEVNRLADAEFSGDAMKEYLGSAPSAFLEKPVRPERLRKEISLAFGKPRAKSE